MATRHYIGIAESDGNGWSLGFPAFPGTVTTGDTLADLLGHARDALASVVGAMEEDGLTLPASADADTYAPTCDLADYINPHIVIVPVEAAEGNS